MDRRGWRVRHLAVAMEGDALQNRALLWHYLRHPTGDIGLGRMICDSLDAPFGLPKDTFIKIERDDQTQRGTP